MLQRNCKTARWLIAVGVALALLSPEAAHAQRSSLGKIRAQLAHIPEPDATRYLGVHDAMYWQNPYLLVRREGVELRVGATRTTMPVAAVPRALTRIPSAGWPYGRVVAVQALSLTSPAYRGRILNTRGRLLVLLRAVGVKAEVWPD